MQWIINELQKELDLNRVKLNSWLPVGDKQGLNTIRQKILDLDKAVQILTEKQKKEKI